MANLAEQLALEVKKYVEMHIELQKVRSSGSLSSNVATISSFAIIGVFLLLFALFFTMVFIPVILSDLLDSLTLGFGIWCAFLLFISLMLIVFRRRFLKRPILKAIANAMVDLEHSDEKTEIQLLRKQGRLEIELEKQEYRLLKEYVKFKGTYSPASFATNVAAMIVSDNKGAGSGKSEQVRSIVLSVLSMLESYTATARNLAEGKSGFSNNSTTEFTNTTNNNNASTDSRSSDNLQADKAQNNDDDDTDDRDAYVIGRDDV